MTDRKVELVFSSGCPNVEAARANLRSAMAGRGDEAAWTEWTVEDSETPIRVRGYSSPAVLVDGRHVLGERAAASRATACSVHGAPPSSAIAAALREETA